MSDTDDLLDKLRALFPGGTATRDDECADDDEFFCAKCGQDVRVDDDLHWTQGEDVCHHCAHEAYAKARFLLRGGQ